MAIELKVPEVGESITEVQIGEWLKSLGDSADPDDSLVVIETDKVTVELPAPVAGTITKIIKATGETATVGEVIGYMEEGAGAPQAAGGTAASEAAATPPKASESVPSSVADPRVMPAAQRALATEGIEAATVAPTGPGGRILKEDVMRTAQGPQQKQSPRPTPQTAAREPAGVGSREEEVVPMTPMRQRIAERLVQSQQTAALLTTFNEIDMSAVMALRKEHKERFLARYEVKLGFMSFFVKAAVEALKLVPQVNAEVRDQSIAYRNYFDIGIAVGGGKGLVVPIIRNSECLSFADIELSIADFGRRAQSNKLTLDELQGGTFTISNGGVYGSLLSTPIVNPPQSGILGLHGIQERPVALNGEIVIRPMMYVALTYDHRVVDGREAVTFLKKIKECVEQPARILLEV